MSDRFYCGGCGRWKPLSDRVERARRRPKCKSCEARARKLDAVPPPATGLRRPAAKMDEDFLRWVSHV